MEREEFGAKWGWPQSASCAPRKPGGAQPGPPTTRAEGPRQDPGERRERKSRPTPNSPERAPDDAEEKDGRRKEQMNDCGRMEGAPLEVHGLTEAPHPKPRSEAVEELFCEPFESLIESSAMKTSSRRNSKRDH